MRAPGSLLGDPALDRVHQRRVDGRRVADHPLGELELVAVLAEDLADARERVLLAEAGRDAAVDAQLGARRDDVDLRRGLDPRRRERDAEQRLDEHREARVAGAQALERRGRIAVGRDAEPLEQGARALGEVELRLALGHPRQQRRHLQQRVDADLRDRGVAGDAVGRHAKAKDALLGDADAVVALAVVREVRAAALVEQVVAAHLVGVVLADPHRAELAADLLVDDHDDEQVALRRAPARARERQRGGHLGGGLRLHVQRAAAPDEAVGEVARPRVVRPVRRRREHGVDVRQQAQHGPVGVAAQARDEVRPLGLGAEQVDLEAGLAQIRGEALLQDALVAWRVDGVAADEALQQLRRLLLEICGHGRVHASAPSPCGRAGTTH